MHKTPTDYIEYIRFVGLATVYCAIVAFFTGGLPAAAFLVLAVLGAYRGLSAPRWIAASTRRRSKQIADRRWDLTVARAQRRLEEENAGGRYIAPEPYLMSRAEQARHRFIMDRINETRLALVSPVLFSPPTWPDEEAERAS